MNDNCIAAVKVNQDLCSRCKVCYSTCPFEAIRQRPDDGRIEIDIQKCQVCGICYSACPVSAIEMAYYDHAGLLEHVRTACPGAETLVMMCRGNSPSSGEVEDILADHGLDAKEYVPMRVPCAGRVSTDLIFNALASGIRNIVSIQCQDGFCRMKEGTRIETRRLLLSKAVLRQLGYPEDAVQVVKYSRKAVWTGHECVGCDKCVFVCPYGAIEARAISSPRIDPGKCVGCGACQVVCPHNAIQVKGYEFYSVLRSYEEAAERMRKTGRPSVLVFSCQWSEFTALDDPAGVLGGRNAMLLEVPCFKGLDPVHVLTALQSGFDGVMGVVCAPEDCKLKNGRDAAERQLEVLLIALKRLGLSERFELHELSPRCKGEFAQAFDAFYARVSAMPRGGACRREGD